MNPLSTATFDRLKAEFKLGQDADFMKHILAQCDGEIRMIYQGEGIDDWKPFPASGGDVRQHRYWHYQYSTDAEVRHYLYEKSQEHWHDQKLSDREVNWIMTQEKDSTTLLKREKKQPLAGGGGSSGMAM